MSGSMQNRGFFGCVFLVLGFGCGEEAQTTPLGQRIAVGAEVEVSAGDDGFVEEIDDASIPDDTGPEMVWPDPAEVPASWCERALGGDPGAVAFSAGFAHAHVSQRLFGPGADWLGADGILVDALDVETPFEAETVANYADQFPDVCALAAQVGSLPISELELVDGAAWITPGAGVPTLPADTTHVVIDLRQVMQGADVWACAALALGSPEVIGSRKVRRFQGFPSQEEGWTHYESDLVSLEVVIPSGGDVDLPLTFVTGPRLSPEAAMVAAGLRLKNRATLVGYDVYSSVAESHWSGIGDSGLLWRGGHFQTGAAPWPDVVSADIQSLDFEQAVLDAREMTPASFDGPATRTGMSVYDREAGEPPTTLTRGAMRAALMVAYGTFDRFYPFFHLVGRHIDEALAAGLMEVEAAEAGDRQAMRHILGRFMHEIYDGHGFLWDAGQEDWSDGYLGIQVQELAGLPVVRTSVQDGLQAGDTIVEVDGVASEQWYEEVMRRYSASSDGYRFVLATDELKEVWGTKEMKVLHASGEEDTVELTGSWSNFDAVPWGGTDRPSGWLDELGAESIYYVNMASAITPDEGPIVSIFDQVMGADGVILDMRDYPTLDIYEFARYWNPQHFTAPIFGHPTWTGPDAFETVDEVWSWDPAPLVYEGPVVLMVSAKTVSAGECFAQMVMDLPNVTVVGQQSASTNGTITNAWLPGRYQVTWTGMWLRNPDGSEFHGIGVVPDVEVTPSPQQFAAGEDPELLAAIDVLVP